MGSSKHHRDSDEDRRSKKHKRSKEKTSHSPRTDIEPISKDDYFEKATEFRLWLREKKHKYFGDLDKDDSRYYFAKFVKAWNKGDLDDKFYAGVNSTQLTSSDTTRYKWGFAKTLNQHEQDRIRDSVDTMTNRDKNTDRHSGSSSSIRRPRAGPAMLPPGPQLDQVDKEERMERERAERRFEKRQSRSRKEEYLDEVAPKETGREAAIAKRRALNAYHKREKSPDIEFSEADLMGGDDFQARLAAQKRSEERRRERQTEKQQQRMAPLQNKMAEYKAKEDATIEMFKRMAAEQKQRGAF
ncbi:uncharacterized protein BYT42DRAFT_580631 [Radiomyces spectabilis]|uniref:uncharacterized protein n=1 Tax=Radiomyces spectabilis TaxID=64574 RepID=UPI00221FD761|nr:uncharacterized protein BYT42DRAFT_580631 [Radiomyces spectabilis]KAI8371540.1 hypothetical protein BYT42DRAFT_580631 [Radiomyces spectabilis]